MWRLLRMVGCFATSRYAAVVVAWYAYAWLTRGFFTSRSVQFYTEVPLLLCGYHLLWVIQRPGWSRAVLAALPIASVYAVHDYTYWVFGTVPEWFDIDQVPDLGLVFGPWAFGAAVAAAVGPFALCVLRTDVRRLPRNLLHPVHTPAFVLFFGLIGAVSFAPATVAEATDALDLRRDKLHPPSDAARYGRVFMSLVRHAERRSYTTFTEFQSPEAVGLTLDPEVANAIERRNVHIIVMESFIDPRRYKGLKFNRDPFADAFRALIGDRANGSLAPGVGTGTARSEFEILCGRPSLRLAGPTEFQVLTGAPAPCMPALFASLGYATQSSFPGTPSFYNAVRAYRTVGFARSLFGGASVHADKETIRPSGWKGDLFDAFLFEQNREHIREHLEKGTPFFNYVLTMYGHVPFERDPEHQPDVIEIDKKEEYEVLRIANQAYYRTQALADHLEELRRLDPTSLVIAVGDHLPATLTGLISYLRLGYLDAKHIDMEELRETLLIIMDKGEFVKLPDVVSHFDLRGVLLDRLSNGAWCKKAERCRFGKVRTDQERKDAHLEAYKTIVGFGSRPVSASATP